MSNFEPSKRASALILQIRWKRHVCVSAGSEIVLNGDGADQILNILREYLAPGAVDAVYQQVLRLLQLKGTDRAMDVFRAVFDALRRKE